MIGQTNSVLVLGGIRIGIDLRLIFLPDPYCEKFKEMIAILPR